jgi:hypothetical protein
MQRGTMNHRNLLHVRLLAGAALCLAIGSGLTACIEIAAEDDGGDGDGEGGSPSESTASSSSDVPILDCPGIFTCAETCTDAACEEACIAAGSPEAQAAVYAMVECYTNNGCQDTDCFQQNCSQEINDCVNPQTGGPPPTDVPQGSAPADVVGSWHYFYAGTANTDDWTFDANGNATHYVASSFQMGGCVYAGIDDSAGTVVFTDTKLFYYKTSGTVAQDSCGVQTTEAVTPATYEFDWSLQDGKLVLRARDIPACTMEPPAPSCILTYERQ